MARIRAVLLLALLASWSGAAIAAPETGATLRLSKVKARQLVKALLHGKDAPRARSLAQLLRTRPEDREALIQVFGEGVFQPDRAHAKLPRVRTETIAFDGGEMPRGTFVVQLPDAYTGKKPMPVLFRFHGTGDDGASYSRGWAQTTPARSFISITPTIPTARRMDWRTGGVKGFYAALYRHVLSTYNVDTDRCYYSGYSAGGAAAFFYAQTWPHHCASIFARGRLWWNHNENPDDCAAVLQHVPGFYLVGENDAADRVQGFRRTQAFFSEHRYPGEFHFVPGKGHDYMPEFDAKGFPFLLEQQRVKFPKEFRGYYFTYGNMRGEAPHNVEQYWMRVLEHDRRGAKSHVRVEGNRITITAERVTKARLHLNDEIVDLDEPVVVVLNGKEVFRGRVERSVEFLLKWFDDHRDPRRLFWNAVEIGGGS